MKTSVFDIIYLVGFLVGCVVRGISVRGHRRREVAETRRNALDTTLVTLAGIGLMGPPLVYLFLPWLDFANYAMPGWLAWPGAPIFAGAIVLLWRAHADLGMRFSPTLALRPDHALVTSGVYARIRHPMYAAHALWAVAQILLLHNWIAGPSFAAFFVPFCLYRIPREERMMRDRFGEAYDDYVNRTGRLLPRTTATGR